MDALTALQPFDVFLQLLRLEDARVARSLGKRLRQIVGAHARCIVCGITLDHPKVGICLKERLDEPVLDRQHLPTAAIQTLGQIPVL